MEDEELRASWNRIAARYAQEMPPAGDAPRYGPFAPDEDSLRLLGDLEGKRVLELGCGGGQNMVAFARRGATCLGIDLSDAQIDLARALADQEGARSCLAFRQSEMVAFLEAMQSDGSETFDIVFSVNALAYVADLTRCFRGVSRALRPGGVFVFALDHPLAAITAWDANTQQVIVRDSYFDRTRDTWNWESPDTDSPLPMVSYFRTFGDILGALNGSGLIVNRLLEPEPTAEFVTHLSPDDAERFARIPATLIVRAILSSNPPLPQRGRGGWG